MPVFIKEWKKDTPRYAHILPKNGDKTGLILPKNGDKTGLILTTRVGTPLPAPPG